MESPANLTGQGLVNRDVVIQDELVEKPPQETQGQEEEEVQVERGNIRATTCTGF